MTQEELCHSSLGECYLHFISVRAELRTFKRDEETLHSEYQVVRRSKGYFEATRGYVIYSPRAQPEVNESHIHEVPQSNWLIFHMGEVSHG